VGTVCQNQVASGVEQKLLIKMPHLLRNKLKRGVAGYTVNFVRPFCCRMNQQRPSSRLSLTAKENKPEGYEK